MDDFKNTETHTISCGTDNRLHILLPKMSGKAWITAGIVIAATLFRIMLNLKLPLYIQAGADFDDHLLAKYANTLLGADWLGAYNALTLAKTVSYSVFLAVNFLLGIRYQLALILFYTAGIILLVNELGKHFRSGSFKTVLYLVLLYSPVMLHNENVQRVYRGGVLVCASVFVLAAFIGIFNARNKSIRVLLGYSILASAMLPFFYFLKEDGIWILPFCAGAAAVTAISLRLPATRVPENACRQEASGGIRGGWCTGKWLACRLMLVILPFVSLLAAGTAYKGMNYLMYGVYATTDRQGTNFEKLCSDLIRIESDGDGADLFYVWVSRNAVYDAMENSPTFNNYKQIIDENMYAPGSPWLQADGEFYGDFYIWALRRSFELAGVYGGGAARADNIYGKIHEELQQAVDSGRLKEKSGVFYPSGVSKGITLSDLSYFAETFGQKLGVLSEYKMNCLDLNVAYGDAASIQEMSEITCTPAKWPDTGETVEEKWMRVFIAIGNGIVSVYQKTGRLCLLAGAIGVVIFCCTTVIGLFHKNYTRLPLLLIIIGLLAVGMINFLEIQWFTSFLNDDKFYDYISCSIPIMQVLEVTGIYELGRIAAKLRRRFLPADASAA